MGSGWDQNGPEADGFATPIRPYRRAEAASGRPVFIPPQSGAALSAHSQADVSPKPDGLVRAIAIRPARFPFGWTHPNEKNARQIKRVEHVLIEKVGPTFSEHARDRNRSRPEPIPTDHTA
jgi:hypothetical protein